MVGACMGEQGMLSGILGIRASGALTFGWAEQGEETAPGQPTDVSCGISTALNRLSRLPRCTALQATQSPTRCALGDELGLPAEE